MKKILTLVLIATLLISCEKQEIKPSTPSNNTTTTTTTTPTNTNTTNTIEIAAYKEGYTTGSSSNLTIPYNTNSRDLVVTLNGYVILQYNSNYPVYTLNNRWKFTTTDKGEIKVTLKRDALSNTVVLSAGIYINGTQKVFSRLQNQDVTITYILK
jgi:ribosome-associated toxin RatA of RatAB toxin-antitoxin module